MDFNDMFGKMYGKLASGMCRLSMNGDSTVVANTTATDGISW